MPGCAEQQNDALISLKMKNDPLIQVTYFHARPDGKIEAVAPTGRRE